jgi:hypothetical protein
MRHLLMIPLATLRSSLLPLEVGADLKVLEVK